MSLRYMNFSSFFSVEFQVYDLKKFKSSLKSTLKVYLHFKKSNKKTSRGLCQFIKTIHSIHQDEFIGLSRQIKSIVLTSARSKKKLPIEINRELSLLN